MEAQSLSINLKKVIFDFVLVLIQLNPLFPPIFITKIRKEDQHEKVQKLKKMTDQLPK